MLVDCEPVAWPKGFGLVQKATHPFEEQRMAKVQNFGGGVRE